MNRVGIFWDYENCAPPSGTPGYVVAERVRATCGAYGSVTQFRAYLELSAPPPAAPSPLATPELNSNGPCPPTSPKTLSLRSELQSSGISLIDCPHNSRKNVADSMLACDLVCFALDNPTPQIPHANYLPASPYNIPNTPFSAIYPSSMPTSKTTIVLISGDRDFAYPLAVLKARKYEVGLIVPPGGAHPALRAQATWVMNWKDILEGGYATDGRQDATVGTSFRGRVDNMGVDGSTTGPTPPSQGVRRPSFASRRGSISSSRRGSVSALPNPVPPPPHLATAIGSSTTSHSLSVFGGHEGVSNSFVSNIPLLEGLSTSQLLSTSRPSRKSPLRRPMVKAGARPPSRSKSRIGTRPSRLERMEQEASQPVKLEQPRPQPLIVPVPLTASPIGSAGPSLAGMSPRAGRPQTPPLFSTNLKSPPPPAAPPALPSSATPPIKAHTPPAKPSTPPRDAVRHPHRPSIPYVATPRPPILERCPPAALGISSPKEQHPDEPLPTSTLITPTPKSSTNVLQSLLPAAPALRPMAAGPTRPVLAVPPSIQTSNTSTLAPATPVTPPASPPFRWTRLQPVHDDTDGDIDRSSTTEKKPKAGKEKAKERTNPASVVNESHLLANPREATGSTSKKKSMKLAVQVGVLIGSEEPSAVSGVDSILRSYTERSPKVERDDQKHHSLEEGRSSPENSLEQKCEACVPLNPTIDDDDDDEEERFHETFLATFSRPSVCSNAPRTPATVKLVSLELTSEENSEGAPGAIDHKKPRVTTPRPVARTSHSLPLVPMMQSLLAGVESGQPIPGDRSDVAGTSLKPEASRHEAIVGAGGRPESLYSRANSPTPVAPPPIHRRKTSPPRITEAFSDMKFDLLVSATYREFQFLITALERCRLNGQERPLRSLIGAEFTRDVFEQAKATSFKDHVQRAVAAGVVSVGDGPVQGREWISLNVYWQGLGSVRLNNNNN
ncbi:unnamed protein product [Rhizoctonia solani]|uniref:NYN domain-containing protein n=1 Tax=Rhizoctonia solani TaxID=456999 RepID=A0A8H2WIR8_9AGAM|nr:unnamed protein product [Rhizoctonia solani]